MGAMPKLKKKLELRYRKGSTNESRNCRYCIQFVKLQEEVQHNPQHIEGRCLIFGNNMGSRYRVWSDYTCDAQHFDDEKRTW